VGQEVFGVNATHTAGKYAKALASFFVVFAGFCAALAASPALVAVFPATWVAVMSAIGVAGTIAGVVGLVPNVLDAKQVMKYTPVDELAKVGTQVATTVATVAVQQAGDLASKAVEKYVNSAAHEMPQPQREQVERIAGIASDVVNATAGSLADRIVKGYDND
jgi:hypothetical protein